MEKKPIKKSPINELTLQPGGHTIQLLFHEGMTQVQTRVKYPSRYIKTVLDDPQNNGLRLKEVYDITDRKQVRLIWKDGQ